jgi:Icc protein
LTSSITLLQITDLHLLENPDARLLGVDTADSLRAVLTQAFSQATPDAVIASGDITHHGEARAYARFDAILAEFFAGPVLVLPGNHDESGPMARYGGERSLLQFPAWTVIGVDSHENGQPGARLTSADLHSLREQCRQAAAESKRVLIVAHHPMLDVGCPWLDKDRIQNADELLEWLAGHSTTAAMVFGHAHQVVEHSYRDIALFGTPATCFQFQPDSATFTIDVDEIRGQPGYRWLQLAGDGTVRSTVERVVDYPDTRSTDKARSTSASER